MRRSYSDFKAVDVKENKPYKVLGLQKNGLGQKFSDIHSCANLF